MTTEIRTQKKRCIYFFVSCIFGLISFLLLEALFLGAIGMAIFIVIQHERPIAIALYLLLFLPVSVLLILSLIPLFRITLQGIFNSFTAFSTKLKFSEVDISLELGAKKWKVSKSSIKHVFRCPKYLILIWETDGKNLTFFADQEFFGKKGIAAVQQAIDVEPIHFPSHAKVIRAIKAPKIECVGSKSFRCYRIFSLPWGKKHKNDLIFHKAL